MPRRIPWREVSPVEPTTTYVVHAGTFVLDRWRNLPRFLRESARVRRRLRGADGLIGFAFMARFSERAFTAVTAWEDRRRLGRCTATPDHYHAAASTVRHLGAGPVLLAWPS